VLLILDLIGFVFFDLVYVVAVVNYAAQSEMNIYLLSAIKKLVHDKGYGEDGLDASIKVCAHLSTFLLVLSCEGVTLYLLIFFMHETLYQFWQCAAELIVHCATLYLHYHLQDIIECRKYLRVLNGKTATATALILFNLGSAGITGKGALDL